MKNAPSVPLIASAGKAGVSLLDIYRSHQSSKNPLIFRVEVGSRSKVEISGSTRVKFRVEGRRSRSKVEIFLNLFLNF